MDSVSGKVAIVTGSSSGIGLGIARELAKAGAIVILAARRADRLAEIAEEIAAAGGRAHAIPTDVTQEEDVLALFSETERLAGTPDILVNNAGIADDKAIDELSLERWREVMDANLTSAFLCSREAFRVMKQKGGGRIINIGSLSAKVPRAHSIAYNASKFAIEGLTRSLALDGRDFNVTATTLHPGSTVSSLVPGVTEHLKENVIDPAYLGRYVVLMASLPPEIAVLDTTILPVKVPFLGRG